MSAPALKAAVERPDEVEDDHLPLDMALALLATCTDMATYTGAGSANVAYTARLAEAALSSQAEAMEAMAKALEPFAWFAENGSSAQYIQSLAEGEGDDGWCASASFRAGSFLNARTALSQYRTLGGE